jgi:hypothetical protein
MSDAFTATGQLLHRQLGRILATPVLHGEKDPLGFGVRCTCDSKTCCQSSNYPVAAHT